MAIGTAIGLGLSALGGVANMINNQQNRNAQINANALNLDNANRINQNNLNWQREQYYNNLDREDTALSRMLLQGANSGISPLALLNSGFSGAVVGNSGSFSGSTAMPNMVAPQQALDLSGISALGSQLGNLNVKEKEVSNIKDFNDKMYDLQNTEIGLKHSEFLADQKRLAEEYDKARDDKFKLDELDRQQAQNLAIMEIASREKLSYAQIKADKEKYTAEIRHSNDMHFRELKQRRESDEAWRKHDTARQVSDNINMVWNNTLRTLNPLQPTMTMTSTFDADGNLTGSTNTYRGNKR